MKKLYHIFLGNLRKKTVFLVVSILIVTTMAFSLVSAYQNRMLVGVVGETRTEQQQAISQSSRETMHQVLMSTLSTTTSLEAEVLDDGFSEIVDDIHMLENLAIEVFENRDSLEPVAVGLPDPAMDGKASAMALAEEGVDYRDSALFAAASHLSSPMIAMFESSDKIDSCYIGLADGTDLCVDEKPTIKLDNRGVPISFPVRERPWYKGAVEAGGIYFTGIEEDAFSGKLLVTCSLPVTVRGEFIGVIGIDILLDEMNEFVGSSAGNTGTIFVVNENGKVILSSEEEGFFAAERNEKARDLRTLGNEELASFVDQALSQKTELSLITIDNRKYYAAGAPMPTVGWSVVTIIDQEVTEQPEKVLLIEYERINDAASEKFKSGSLRTQITGWLIAVLVFGASIGAALYAAYRLVKPLKAMTNDIIEGGKTGKLFEMKDTYRTHDEIQVLAESFDDLSQKTKKYIEDITEITAEKERVNTELNMANQIQSSMLPHIFPAFPTRSEFDIYASMDPAKEVGGDFYDFFLIDDDHLCMVIADVSGKGVPAALFMMVSKAMLKNNALSGRSPGEILALTNDTICSNNKMQMFVTVWLGILEISTGRITAANAGHEYPAVLQDGCFSLLHDKHGFIIGGMEGMKYKEYEIQLHPGDKLFLYTDGVPEATDSENKMFGPDRMLTALQKAKDAEPDRILEAVREAVEGFVRDAEQFDDLTMLCVEYKGPEEKENGKEPS